MVFTCLILIGIDVVVLIHLFLLSFSFSWEDRCTCVNCIKQRRPYFITFPTPQILPNIFRCMFNILNTLFSIFGSLIKHGLSCLMYYIIDTAIAVCYSFKEVRAKLRLIFNLTCMGHPYHLRDTSQHWRA